MLLLLLIVAKPRLRDSDFFFNIDCPFSVFLRFKNGSSHLSDSVVAAEAFSTRLETVSTFSGEPACMHSGDVGLLLFSLLSMNSALTIGVFGILYFGCRICTELYKHNMYIYQPDSD